MFSQDAAVPSIEQRIAGTGIEAKHRLRMVRREIRDIGNAADVDDCPVVAARVKQVLMKCRHQRRALAAGGDIARAKSATVDAGAFPL